MKFIKKNICYILGILTVLFFLLGQGVTWYAFGGDTEAYYIFFGHHIEAKPLYPLFFHILNTIFGDGMYLYAAAVIQIALAICCIMLFVCYLKKIFCLETFSVCCIWAASLIPFVLLLPEDPIPHVLMTESFTYPLMYVYAVIVLKGICEDKVKYLFASSLFVVLLTLIRGQMLFLMAVTLLAFLYYLIKNRCKNPKTIITFMAFMLICAWGQGMLARGYEKLFFDAPAQDYAAQTLVQKALYCSEEDDGELFDDKIEREIFERTYAGMEEEQTTWRYSTGDLWDWKRITAGFGANSYRVGDVIEEVLTEHGMWSGDALERENLVLDYSRRLSSGLISAHLGRFLWVSVKMMPAGFVSTVLFHKESIYLLIHIATVFLYLVAIGVSIFISKKSGRLLRETEYMMLIVITASVNVVASNLVHFGLQRYLAYTVGMFYVGAYLLLRRCFLMWKERKVVRK